MLKNTFKITCKLFTYTELISIVLALRVINGNFKMGKKKNVFFSVFFFFFPIRLL